MKTRNIVMLTALATLFVTAAVLTIVFVVTHDEAGLLTACETDAGEYDYDADCFDVRLEGSAPFTVDLFDPEHHQESGSEAVEAIVEAINDDVGMTLLVAGDLEDGLCLDDATICANVGAPWQRNFMDHHGTASHNRTPMGLYCMAETSNTGTDELRHQVLWHEIGHCLGLAHDDFDSSIMRARQSATPMGQFPPSFTDHDVELLRELYDSR